MLSADQTQGPFYDPLSPKFKVSTDPKEDTTSYAAFWKHCEDTIGTFRAHVSWEDKEAYDEAYAWT